VARIDTPALLFLTIVSFDEFIFEIPQLFQFISRAKMLKSLNDMVVRPDLEQIGIAFGQLGERRALEWGCGFHIPCKQFDEHLSFMAQIITLLSPLLSNVNTLGILEGSNPPPGQEEVDPLQWLELFQPLGHVKRVLVNEEYVSDIVDALLTEETAAPVLPGLTSLCLEGYRNSPTVAEAAEDFIAIRNLAGHNISLHG